MNKKDIEKTSLDNVTKGSILSSPMFRRFLVPIIATMLIFTGAVYFFAVPYLKDLVYSLEEKSVQTNLKNIHKLIEANSLAIEAYRESVTSAHERQLKNITLFMETYLKNKYDQVQKGIISKEEAQQSALEELRAFRYGSNDYVWVADYKGRYLSHPDPTMNRKDFSQVRDVFGNYVLTPLIQQAREKGDGYHSFWLQRLGNDLPAEKLAYGKLFPQWEWVIGTGVYLDDLEKEIILRKEKMIEELRQILKPIIIGRTGYMYIFDAWKNIIIHPNAALENMSMSSWTNHYTGNKLADDLMATAHSEKKMVAYTWDRPDDPSNYRYEKIDWITHVDNFDWYVVASVYTDELNTSSILLRNRIFILGVAVVALSAIIVSLLMSRLLNPIRRLSHTVSLVESGDLTARSDINSKDEIGFLARAFNAMIDQVRETIRGLDDKVMERTRDLNRSNDELTETIEKLEQHNQRVTRLNQMAQNFQNCSAEKEVCAVIMETMAGFFQEASGLLYLCDSGKVNNHLTPILRWGETKLSYSEHEVHECRAFDTGEVFIFESTGDDPVPCAHIRASGPYTSICIPLHSQKETLGLVSLIFVNADQGLLPKEKAKKREIRQTVIASVADHFAIALSNMRLRDKLQELSIRDRLTELYNRRFMEETLEREFIQAERSRHPVGIIILDVDFFKKFNDTYGHKAGDAVLVEVARLLSNSIRKGDVACRYGGEEFLLILPNTSFESAVERAEAIRTKVEILRLEYNAHVLQVTVSLGIAVYPDHGNTPDAVLKEADNALYRAKEQGRNRTVFPAPTEPHLY